MTHRLIIAVLLNILLIPSGCAKLTSKPWAEINDHRFTIEVADTPELRERGLMFRRENLPMPVCCSYTMRPAQSLIG